MIETEDTKLRIVAVAKELISAQVGLVEGCRELVQLAARLDESDRDLFAPILGVESETDDHPVGSARLRWSEDVLKKKDEELEHYLSLARPEVFKVCDLLVERFSKARGDR